MVDPKISFFDISFLITVTVRACVRACVGARARVCVLVKINTLRLRLSNGSGLCFSDRSVWESLRATRSREPRQGTLVHKKCYLSWLSHCELILT